MTDAELRPLIAEALAWRNGHINVVAGIEALTRRPQVWLERYSQPNKVDHIVLADRPKTNGHLVVRELSLRVAAI